LSLWWTTGQSVFEQPRGQLGSISLLTKKKKGGVLNGGVKSPRQKERREMCTIQIWYTRKAGYESLKSEEYLEERKTNEREKRCISGFEKLESDDRKTPE